MGSNCGDHAKIEMGAVVKENIEKCELQFEESGADIEEMFTKLYGEPGQPISAEEQRENINKGNARRKRAERVSGENMENEKTVEKSGNTTSEMDLIDEDVIKRDSVNVEEAEIDWDKIDKVLEKLCSPENVGTAAKWFGGLCSVV